jgi:2-methylcitrate dehydratase
VKRAVVTVTTLDGTPYTRQEDFAKGSPERPLSDDDVVDKFRANASHAMSAKALDRIVDATLHLEDFKTTGEYARCLVRG